MKYKITAIIVTISMLFAMVLPCNAMYLQELVDNDNTTFWDWLLLDENSSLLETLKLYLTDEQKQEISDYYNNDRFVNGIEMPKSGAGRDWFIYLSDAYDDYKNEIKTANNDSTEFRQDQLYQVPLYIGSSAASNWCKKLIHDGNDYKEFISNPPTSTDDTPYNNVFYIGFEVPKTGYYKLKIISNSGFYDKNIVGNTEKNIYSFDSNNYFKYNTNTNYPGCYYAVKGQRFIFRVQHYINRDYHYKIYCNGYLQYVPINSEKDVETISLDETQKENIYAVNEDKTVTTPTQNIFDTSTGTITLPDGSTVTLSDYIYDLATRTYKDTSGNSVTYGDQYITVTTTDSNNVTNNYYYYYGTPTLNDDGTIKIPTTTPTGPTNPDTPSTDKPWYEKLWDGLSGIVGNVGGGIGSILSTLIEALGGVISGIIDGIVSLLDNVIQQLQKLPNLMTSFSNFLGSLFSWLPQEIQIIIGSSISLFLIIGLIKIFI